MAFTEEQVTELNKPLASSVVKTRSQSGRSLSYIEGYHAINEANRIFGFGEWDNQVISLTPVVTASQGEPNYEGSNGKKGYLVAYIATVRVTVRMADGATQTHEDVGYGEGIDYKNVGQAHESATKEAVTDALKRCLKDWGNPFGLALYDKDQRNVEDDRGNGNGRHQSNGKPKEAAPNRDDLNTMAYAYLKSAHRMSPDDYADFINFRLGDNPKAVDVGKLKLLAGYCNAAQHGNENAKRGVKKAVEEWRKAKKETGAGEYMDPNPDDVPTGEEVDQPTLAGVQS